MENKVFDFTLNLDWNLLKNVSKLDRFDASCRKNVPNLMNIGLFVLLRYLLVSGVGLRYLQEILGQNSPK